jgi:hypothetical protein
LSLNKDENYKIFERDVSWTVAPQVLKKEPAHVLDKRPWLLIGCSKEKSFNDKRIKNKFF